MRERERGAIAAIVAMLFGFGVLLSLAALTVDVGNINADRRQLQNGADAVALAVAQRCVKDKTCLTVLSDGSLQKLADANASDGATSIRRVDRAVGTALEGQPAICGNAKDLTACPTTWTAGISKLQECPSTPASGLNYVRVYAETKNSAGDNLLPYYFGAAITGISGANQQACASVAWGPAVPPNAFPVTFSPCDYQAATAAGIVAPPLGPSPGYGPAGNTNGNTTWPAAGTEVVLNTAKNTTPDCTSWNGHLAPGNFGTLDGAPTIPCSAQIVDGWVGGTAGNAGPNTCGESTPPGPDDLNGKLGHIIYIPIFDCFSDTKVIGVNCKDGKNHDWFHVQGYAPFYLTGYYFSGSKLGDSIFPDSVFPGKKGAVPCSGGQRCISGWFTTSTLQDTLIDTSGAPNTGATAIKMNG